MQILKLKRMSRVKKYKTYKGQQGRIAPNLLNRAFKAAQSKMGYRYNRVQCIWKEIIAIACYRLV